MDKFKKDRVRGSLIGGAVGDALGYAVEFINSYESICKFYGEEGITEMDINNTSGKGQISDDTQMTLFTACALLDARKLNRTPVQSACWAYLEWLNTQKGVRNQKMKDYWIGDMPEMNVRRAPGRTCIEALENLRKGREALNDRKGCGGIMRIAPVPLYGLLQGMDIIEANGLAAELAYITHQHPLGYIPAYVMSHLIFRLAADENPTREAFRTYLDESLKLVHERYAAFSSYVRQLEVLIRKAVDLAVQDLPDHQCIKAIGDGWVAEETLAIAIYCVYKYFDDFGKAMVAAVNHGGDSDSTGSVAGNILGAAVGYNAIPEHFKRDLELHDVILHVADDLCHGYTTRYTPID